MDNMKRRRLQELKRSDFEIVDSDPDIRGWDVKDAHGKKIGEVEELIVDAQQKKIRYMVVDLDDNDLDLDDKEVLIPIGLAQLHSKDDDVILPNVRVEQLTALPEYDEDHLDADMERQICSTLGRKEMTDTASTVANANVSTTGKSSELESNFYQHAYFNDDNLYANRLHEARPVKTESEYERGLRLWERRSEGGIIDEGRSRTEDSYTERQRKEQEELQAVRNKKNAGNRQDNSVKRRTTDEGLRDA